jgi:predicted RNase H-like HicB family nuclease
MSKSDRHDAIDGRSRTSVVLLENGGEVLATVLGGEMQKPKKRPTKPNPGQESAEL